jgi:NAD(P)-dependent dehydrogenase (short-subunit alcohol dehydrogenase family)
MPVTDELFDIRGKVALVTGGTSGIGQMIARGLATRCARVYLTGRDLSRARETAARLPGQCIGLAADLADPQAPAELAAQFARLEPALHLLVNNAGANDGAAIEAVTPAAWDQVMGVNLRAAFLLVQQLLPQLRAAGSTRDPARVINIGSVGGLHIPAWDAFAYGASKAALHHLTRALAKRLGRDAITVNAIAPGPFPSRMTDTANESVQRRIKSDIPLGRAGEPQDIEGMVVFLASRAGAYVSGATLPLDGGCTAAL